MKSLSTEQLNLGIDIGSISINAILLNHSNEIVYEDYTYCFGKPFHVLLEILRKINQQFNFDSIESVSLTGNGGKQASDLIGGIFVNEIVAQSKSTSILYPNVKTIIEMGGEDSKLIQMEKKGTDSSQLSDFTMNSLCAAGTGSFLDQQAKRIGVSIVDEFGKLALQSKKPPRIAGRCSVFAKSDMIHLQQIATPLHDIVAGLCYAVARNFKSTLGRGKQLHKPFSFQGGVSANQGMIRAFRDIFDLRDNELIIPKNYASMGAIGAALYIKSEQKNDNSYKFKGFEELEAYLNQANINSVAHAKLEESKAVYDKTVYENGFEGKIDVSLGVDVGSLSTNVVLIDEKNRVVARRYLPTASKPINAVQIGLEEIFNEIGDRVNVCSAGTTGSGRYLTGDFIGADTIQNEITAQATAAIAHDPTVDTIFEIGGQDSKYISIENGVVVDFEMNKVCAAGTGSFLEEQAEKLNINIKEEFGEIALDAPKPVRLGDRCTVFMESDLNSYQQKGANKENLIGGLAYSIVQNYLNRVVGDKPVGNKIFFQGGVTNNKSVVSAFEKVTGKAITIPPHFDVTGAIGVAMLARNSMGAKQTKFKGFNIRNKPFKVDSFTCKECANNCDIQRVKVEGENKALFYGGRCEKYEVEERKNKVSDIPNYFEERINFLLDTYQEKREEKKTTIGIPRALMVFYQQFPFWNTFFADLGFQVVLSDISDKNIVKNSLELMVTETCMPVELMHGHVANLIDKDVDFIFTPFIVNAKANHDNPTNNCNCPWIQTSPFMLKSAFKDESILNKLLIPTLHFRYFERAFNKELPNFMLDKFGIPKSQSLKAIQKADKVQIKFESRLIERGKEILSNLPKDKTPLVVFGRPYNTGDPFLNLRLVEKLISLNTIPIPVDYLPLDQEDIFEDYPMMYWPNGQKIIAASKIVQKNKQLFGVYLSNFRCGPDSFLTHYVREEMKGKPYLHLEIDEHSADAGMITRLEAFLDSLNGYKKSILNKEITIVHSNGKKNQFKGRTLYYPYARDTVHALAASSRYCGIDAHVLPMPNEEDLEIARKLTNGHECFPLICTLGSFVKKIQEPGIDPKKISFFMPDHNGPCRFGDYNKLQRIVFDRLGFKDVHILTPKNDDSYAEVAPGKSGKFRLNSWKGIVALDLLKKMLQETRPYEFNKGAANGMYHFWMNKVLESIEQGSKGLPNVLEKAGKAFSTMPKRNGQRKPVIAVVGETFMRDNPFCSGFVIDKLEDLGAETIMAPFGEWLIYSTYRYRRDSLWKGDIKGVYKSKIQKIAQHYLQNQLHRKVKDFVEMEREVELEEMIKRSAPYIHKDYDGDPIATIGIASNLVDTKISGIAHIIPFTCMPGTLVSCVSGDFRKDHNNIPWETIAYDGQDDSAITTRLQAFMYQAAEYNKEFN